MKRLLLAIALLAPSTAMADRYILGAGRWTCETLLTANESGDMAKVFQAVGWLLGYWSAESRHQSTRFVDIVEQAGGAALFDQTLAACRIAPAGSLLYEITDSIIETTG